MERVSREDWAKRAICGRKTPDSERLSRTITSRHCCRSPMSSRVFGASKYRAGRRSRSHSPSSSRIAASHAPSCHFNLFDTGGYGQSDELPSAEGASRLLGSERAGRNGPCSFEFD